MLLDRVLVAGKSQLVVLFLAVLVLAVYVGLVPAGAEAAEPCNCVTYLKTGLGLIPSGPLAAADYGPTLQATGFKRLAVPKRGSVMVFARSFPGGDPVYGHVALVESVSRDQRSGLWSVTVRHARWTVGTIVPGAGPCAAWGSVRLTTFSLATLSNASFYRPPRPA